VLLEGVRAAVAEGDVHLAVVEVCLSQSHRSGSELRLIGGAPAVWL
jgi:hypothetical protein